MNVSIFAINDNFLQPIADALRNDKVMRFMPANNPEVDTQNARNLMEWADVVFVDFATTPLPELTKMSTDTPIVARLMGLEVYSKAMMETDWRRVDTLIMPSPQLLRFSKLHLPSIPKIETLPVGTDTLFFQRQERTPGRNICTVAVSMLPRKRLFTLIESFACLLSQPKQEDWILHLRTAQTDWRRQYQEEYSWFLEEALEVHDLVEKVKIYDAMSPRDYLGWLNKMDIYVANATQEGYCKAVMDAAACGVYPLVYRWLGADTIWQPQYLFRSQWELISKIKKWGRLSDKQKHHRSVRASSFVQKHHDEVDVGRRIREILVRAVET